MTQQQQQLQLSRAESAKVEEKKKATAPDRHHVPIRASKASCSPRIDAGSGKAPKQVFTARSPHKARNSMASIVSEGGPPVEVRFASTFGTKRLLAWRPKSSARPPTTQRVGGDGWRYQTWFDPQMGDHRILLFHSLLMW